MKLCQIRVLESPRLFHMLCQFNMDAKTNTQRYILVEEFYFIIIIKRCLKPIESSTWKVVGEAIFKLKQHANIFCFTFQISKLVSLKKGRDTYLKLIEIVNMFDFFSA